MLSWGLSVFLQFILSLVAVAFTLIFIDPVLLRLQREADKQSEAKRLKSELIEKLHSRVVGVAAVASEQLSQRGWARDGSLVNLNLSEANLDNARLMGANIRQGWFHGTSLRQADLRSVHVEEAEFIESDLRGADLTGAYLCDAIFENANLEGTFLDGANLQGAELTGANCKNMRWQGAQLNWPRSDDSITFSAAKFDENTCLPDGTRWTAATDFSRFTDPTHPQFWQPESAKRSDNKTQAAH